MASLREAMRVVAKNTSRILSPDVKERLARSMDELDKKYQDMEAKLRNALYDNVGLENEVLYLKTKLDEAKGKIEEGKKEAQELRKRLLDSATKLQETTKAAASSVAKPTKKASSKKSSKKKPAKKTKKKTTTKK